MVDRNWFLNKIKPLVYEFPKYKIVFKIGTSCHESDTFISYLMNPNCAKFMEQGIYFPNYETYSMFLSYEDVMVGCNEIYKLYKSHKIKEG